MTCLAEPAEAKNSGGSSWAHQTTSGLGARATAAKIRKKTGYLKTLGDMGLNFFTPTSKKV